MSRRQDEYLQQAIIALVLAAIVCLIIQIMSVYQYNSTLRTAVGTSEQDGIRMDIRPRGNDTSSWVKREAHLTGEIFDAVLQNQSDMEVQSWTLQINILGNCYLNQFWNGEVEIHQHVNLEECVQRLNLASYSLDEITLEYMTDASDLLIPLSAGDYIVYYPSIPIGEMPVDPGDDTIVGMILYTAEGTTPVLTDYQTCFYFRKSLHHGFLFVLACVLAVFSLLLLAHYISAKMIYRRAQKDIDLRVEGISCMRKLYTAIYIIDLEKDRIMPAGERNSGDDQQPSGMKANEYLQRLMDPNDQYQGTVQVFASLDTLPGRLTNLDYVTLDYITRRDGWRRVCFIPMEQRFQRLPERILFTLQDINGEKEELVSARRQMEKTRSAKEESREFMESISAGIQTPLRSILDRSDTLLAKGTDPALRGCADDIRQTTEMLISMVDSTLDLARLNAGKMKLMEAAYSMSDLVEEVKDMFGISAAEKGVDFRTELSADLPDALIGDRPKLKEILFHLLGRALGSMESGAIHLRIFGKKQNERSCHLLISVQGIGTPTDFESSLVSMDLASGLIRLMGSELRIASLDAGHDFYFEIDQAMAEVAPKAAAPAADGQEPGGEAK